MASPGLYPLIFEPILKERIWGGRRLRELYGKDLPADVPVGESWELSDRPGDISRIANGSFAGKDLHWLVEHFGEQLMGRAPLYRGRFPLLVKILDAREKLSLQVHPPAPKAALLKGEPKTELWYVAEAAPGAQLYVGLRKGCTPDEFRAKIQNGTVENCFHRIPVRAGDAMFLPSGRVHALGAGMVIFEIQQNSDTTYRVFDWNRLGLDGKPRQLHVSESLESIRFDDFEPGLVKPQPISATVRLSSLVQDPLFDVECATFQAGQDLQLHEGEMRMIGVVSGTLTVESPAQTLTLARGGFCLVPASSRGIVLRSKLESTCLLVRAGNLSIT